MISIRWPLHELDDIEKTILSAENPNGTFKDASSAVRELAKVGAKVVEYQVMMQDPEKASEFANKMQEMLKTDDMDQWSQTLTSDQLDGFLMFLNIEKEKRYEQKQFN